MNMPSNYRFTRYENPITYAVKHKNTETLIASRSGGIFTALSDQVLNQDGVVYGCILDESFKAIHIRAESSEDRDRMRGSKYIQSEMQDVFKSVKRDLASGRKVLFSGTSCQVAGLKKYIGKEYDNLVCIDIVCHGVPSLKVWKDYLQWQEKRNHAKIIDVDFRNKIEFGWRAHKETLTFDNGNSVSNNVFTKLFYAHNILRPCCYRCPYKSTIHPGNITIADYWGIERAAPEYDDNKGVSLVLINDETGKKLFDAVKDDIEWKETSIKDSMQPPLIAPFPQPEDRTFFWSDFLNRGFDYIAKNIIFL